MLGSATEDKKKSMEGRKKKEWKLPQLKTQTAKVSQAYRIEPHHPEDPDGEGEIDHQDDNEQKDKQVEATLPPAIDADLVDMVGHRPGRAAALGGGNILLPHHLLAGHNTQRQVQDQQEQMLKRKKRRKKTNTWRWNLSGIRDNRSWKVSGYTDADLWQPIQPFLFWSLGEISCSSTDILSVVFLATWWIKVPYSFSFSAVFGHHHWQ